MKTVAIGQPSASVEWLIGRGRGSWPMVVGGAMVWLMVAMGGCQYESSLGELECEDDEQCPDGAYCEGGYCLALPGAAQISLNADTRTVTAGQSVSFEAVVYDEAGQVLFGEEVQWTSADESIATVDEGGTVAALTVGTTLITASIGELRASAALVVSDVPVVSVVPETTSLSLERDRQAFVTVDILDPQGASLSGRVVEWSSDDEGVAQVSARGDGTAVIYGVSIGVATLTVVSESAEATVEVEVTERAVAAVEIIPGGFTMAEQTSRRLDDPSGVFAQVVDDWGAVLDRDVQWTTSDGSVLLIEEEEGELLLRAQPVAAQREVVLAAEIDGERAEATVTVRPFNVAAVAVSPAGMMLEQYQVYQGFSAQVLSEQGEPIDGGAQMVSWETSDAEVVAIAVNGGALTIEAVGLGTAEISAVYDSELAASAFVTVVPETVSDVEVTPPALTLVEGADEAVAVSIAMGSGEDGGARDVIWSSQNPLVATVNPVGGLDAHIFGHGVGSTPVFGEVEGASAQVDVTVEPRGLAQVAVTPSEFSLKEGQSFQLSATVIADDGRSAPGETVNWEVCDGTGLGAGDWDGCASERAQISTDGVITAQQEGAVSIRAVADGDSAATGEATMTVEQAPVLNVVLTPAVVELILNDTAQDQRLITAEVFTTNGVDGDRSLSFEISPVGVAEVVKTGDQSAEVIALAAGDALVEASADGVGDEAVGRAFVSVAAEPVDNLAIQAVDPASFGGTLMVGDPAVTLQAQATLRGGSTEVVDALWWTDQPTKLAVSEDGQLEAIAGATDISVFAFYEGQEAQLSVNVVEFDTTDIAIAPGSVTLEIGESETLNANIDSGGGCPVSLAWSSDDKSTAVVEGDGAQATVVGVSAGVATISAHCGAATATATVEVAELVDDLIIEVVDPVSFSGTMMVGDPAVILEAQATFFDGSTEVVDALWWTDQPTKLAVSDDGQLEAIAGATNISVFAFYEGQEASLSVNVEEFDTTDIAIAPGSVTLEIGESETLSADIDRGGGCPVSLGWSSGDQTIAVVEGDGAQATVVGVSAGVATISVHCGAATATATVTVEEPPAYAPTSVVLQWVNGQPDFIAVGTTEPLRVVIDADPVAECEVPLLWSTDVPATDVVVNADGTVAVVGGDNGDSVEVTVDCGGVTDQVSFEIAAEPTSIDLGCDVDCVPNPSPAPISSELLADPDTGQLAAEALYNGQAFEACTIFWWSSNSEAIAVDQEGNLSGDDGARATIFASCGGVEKSVDVELDEDWDD